MRPTLLLAVSVPSDFQARLAERFEVVGPLPPPFAESVKSLARDDAARVEIMVTMGTVPAPHDALAHLPSLRLISCMGSGFEGVDLAFARERRIVVTHSPGANAAPVADLAIGLMIASVRRMPEASAFLRRGDWAGNFANRMPLSQGITGRKVGIYGLGVIGEKIARRAAAFETEIGYHNRRRRDDVAYRYFPSLPELAAWCDILVVSVRADADNRHAVDARVLAALGREGHVINIARGSVIDQPALIHALREKTIAGAGLDVYQNEPAVPQELLALDNVALTPHIASGTIDAQAKMHEMVYANVTAFVEGRAVVNPVPGMPASY
jgi:lactate dehydrogenase-like 2-hydroxyacid dehydrogenase